MNETLNWFASVVRQPINIENELLASDLSLQAPLYISPSPTLESFSRIEIYAQQYWWRFFNILQDQYPLLTRLFGYNGFNQQIVTQYILKYPPQHWNINLLGDDLIEWVEKYYNENDRPLILASAKLDWAYIASFMGKTTSLPTTEHQTLYLSPTTFLFELKWDLITFRKSLLKELPEYWIENDFPELKKEETYFIIRRALSGNVTHEKVGFEELALLKEFQKGISLSALCQIANQNEQLKTWIPKWIKHRMITPENPQEN